MGVTRLFQPRDRDAFEMQEGDVLRCTVVDGQQVPDFVFFNLEDLSERLSPTATQLMNGALVIGRGHVIYSNHGRPMLDITECTQNEGVIIGGSCSAPANYARFGVPDTPNCRTNLMEVGKPYGLEEPDVGHIYCPFMTIMPLPDGSYLIDMPKCQAGDYVELRAKMPTLVLLSPCPQVRAITNGFQHTRMHVWIGRDEDARPSLDDILEEAGDLAR
jgi:uncharacterized protein YcgI (DUF1989 family)